MLKNPNHLYGPSDLVVPGHLNFGDYTLGKLREFKNKTALINASTHETATFNDIVQHSMNFAISLARMGLGKGDVVGLMAENRTEYWGAVIGVVCTGAALAAINPTYVQGELVNALNVAKPKYVICSPSAYKNHKKTLNTIKNNTIKDVIIFGSEKLDNTLLYKDLAIDVSSQVKYEEFKAADVNGQTDTLFIIYSSGTTGLPKGVMLTHLNVLSVCCSPATNDPTKQTLAISPWCHVYGLVGFLAGALTGRTGVYLPKFDVDLYLKTIEKYQITQLTVVPPVLVAVCKWPNTYNLSSVKYIYSGAAPLHKETMQDVYQKFPSVLAVFQGYGASEVTLAAMKFMLTDIEDAKRKPGSVGRVVNGVTIKIADTETREALGPNLRGEICVKGIMNMKGYVGLEERDDFDDEGFYKTGDMGYYDDESFFYVVDRLKELIKYKGFQVPPAELEAVLLTHPAVQDVAVIGVPQRSEEVPFAYIVVQKGFNVTEKELQHYVSERLSNPKHLRGGVRFINQIPKSASGKILRKELREFYNNGFSKL